MLQLCPLLLQSLFLFGDSMRGIGELLLQLLSFPQEHSLDSMSCWRNRDSEMGMREERNKKRELEQGKKRREKEERKEREESADLKLLALIHQGLPLLLDPRCLISHGVDVRALLPYAAAQCSQFVHTRFKELDVLAKVLLIAAKVA
jgi:hypothetical protein